MAAARIKHTTTHATPGTPTTVSFTTQSNLVSVFCRSTTYAEVYFTTDGTNPTVGGDDMYLVVAGAMETVNNDLPDYDPGQPGSSNQGVTVKLISSTASVPVTVYVR